MQVLVAEDEQAMAELLRQGLTEEGHHVVLVHDGKEALSVASSFTFDVIVLDVMLPLLDGFGVARHMRERRNKTPILFLTARDARADIVKGLDLGGDDYLTKPFGFDELLARLRALARRGPVPRAVHLQVADLTLDPATHEARRAGQLVKLSPTEFRLLELLIRQAGRVVTRETMIGTIWGPAAEVEANNLDAFMRLLRGKVDADSPVKLIQTVRGVGYILREPER